MPSRKDAQSSQQQLGSILDEHAAREPGVTEAYELYKAVEAVYTSAISSSTYVQTKTSNTTSGESRGSQAV